MPPRPSSRWILNSPCVSARSIAASSCATVSLIRTSPDRSPEGSETSAPQVKQNLLSSGIGVVQCSQIMGPERMLLPRERAGHGRGHICADARSDAELPQTVASPAASSAISRHATRVPTAKPESKWRERDLSGKQSRPHGNLNRPSQRTAGCVDRPGSLMWWSGTTTPWRQGRVKRT